MKLLSVVKILKRNNVDYQKIEKEGKPKWLYVIPFYVYDDNKGKIQCNRVYYNGKRQVIKIKFKNGDSTTCTYNHKFMGNDGFWEIAENFRVGDIVRTSYGNTEISKMVYVKNPEHTWDIEVPVKERYILKKGTISHNTIANITGVTPCVEPLYKNIYTKGNLSGQFLVINRYLVDRLKELNIWNENILNKIKYSDGSIQSINEIPDNIKDEFREVFEIDQNWLIKAAANRSKWIDQSASTNVFLNTPSGKVIDDLYTMVWRMGIKTTYYLRTVAASQAQKMMDSNIVKQQISCSVENGEDCEACE